MSLASPLQVPAIDVKALIAHFDGVTNLVALAAKHGVPLTAKAVEKWRERRSVPMDRWLELVAIDAARVRGRRLTLESFLINGDAR